MTPLTAAARPRAFAPAPSASASCVAGLAGSVLEGRFRHWRGADGRRHLFSVFPLTSPRAVEDLPRYEDAVVIAVARDAAGERRILFADETGPLPDLIFAGAGFRAAVAAGADEVHMHLLTEASAARAALVRDLTTA